MDPQVAWEQLLAAYAEGDWDTLEQRATDLIAWLDRDGFPPNIIKADPDWNAALARAGCRHALDMMQGVWNINI